MKRTTIARAGAVIASGFLFASAVANYLFGVSLGRNGWEAQLLGIVGVLAVGMNAIAPFLLSSALSAKRRTTAAAVASLWTICLVYSATSALGFAAQNRESIVGTREMTRDAYDDTRRELFDLERRREQLKQKDRAEIEKRIDATRAKLATLRDRAPATIDAQSSFLSALSFGLVEPRHVRTALVALFALMIELGATLGLFAALSHATPEAAPTQTRWKPNA